MAEIPRGIIMEGSQALLSMVNTNSLTNRWRVILATAVVGALSVSLLAACARGENKPVVTPPSDCNKPFPEVCLDLSKWNQSGLATLAWESKPGVAKITYITVPL